MKLNIHIFALLEMWLSDAGSTCETEYTIFMHVKATEEHYLFGVCFEVCNSLIACINPPTSSSEHLGKLGLNTANGACFFGSKWKRVSWHHPHSGHWHQLDLVLAYHKQIQGDSA